MANPNVKYHRVKKFMFFSQGTGYAFDPNKNMSYGGKLISMLEFHKQEVLFRNAKDVFILNEIGKPYPVR